MRGANIGDNRDIRLRGRGHTGQLPEMVHAHFRNHDLGFPSHLEQGEGQADLVIQVAFGFLCAELLPEHGVKQFLGRRFADRAGYADHLAAAQPAVAARQVQQRLRSVLHI